MEDNILQIQLDKVMSGLTGLTNCLESTVESSFGKMTTDQALEFANAMKKANISEKVEQIKEESKKLKNEFNIS